MDIIHLLPDSVANQIAAGEVIQRPASCLKELVENSLDAGAKNIDIIIRDAGRTLLQVIDDGSGMSETDARMAFERHATSKIRVADDLFNLHTMGFRGEALASIAAVAQLEVQTRREEDEIGTLLEIASSKVVRQEPVQCKKGTNFKVKNLFFNVPARRRFLKTNSTELRNLLNEFYRIVLVNPDVHFVFVNDDELLFDLPESTLKQRIENVFGKTMRKVYSTQLVDLKAETSVVSIYGYIGKPESASKQAQQYFFVNGRYMRHPYFHKAVISSYSGMLTAEQQPQYFIYFTLSPELIDVNIHPTKTEIKFADEQMIWQILQAALRESLGKFNIAPSLDFDREGDLDIPSSLDNIGQTLNIPQVKINTQYNPFTEHQNRTISVQNWERLYDEPVNIKSKVNDVSSYGLSNHLVELPEIKFDEDISSVTPYHYKNKYIVIPATEGLIFIDQHRAHSAVLYAQLREQMHNNKCVKQQVLFPEVLDLDTDDSTMLIQMTEELQNAGFEIQQIARNSFSVNAVPAELGNQNALAVLLDIIHIASQTGVNTQRELQHRIAITLAEAAAIPTGKPLQETEMRDLTERLFALKGEKYTTDGKQIYAILADSDINKMFI